MKISYTHPTTQNRTSITLSDQIIRLWAIVNHIDISSDDFMDNTNTVELLKIWLSEHHQSFLMGSANFPTFVSYFENIILVEVENRLLRP